MSKQHTSEVAILDVEAMGTHVFEWGSPVTPSNSPSASSSDPDSGSLFTWVEDDHFGPIPGCAQRDCTTSPTDSFVSIDLERDTAADTLLDETTPLLPGRRARDEGSARTCLCDHPCFHLFVFGSSLLILILVVGYLFLRHTIHS